MIITSSQVSLGNAQSDSNRLTQTTKTDLDLNTNPTGPNMVMAVTAHNSYDYSQYNRSQIESQSEVRQGEQATHYNVNHVTEKLTQVSLDAQSAQIAVQKAFPSGSSTNLTLSGEVEFNFTHQIHYQQASNSFLSSQGSVTLADGREVSFNLMLSQQQSTRVNAQTQIEFGLTQLKDPLVINFGSDSVQLQDTTFEFDMQGNGESAHYASLGSGSGYLTFDVNGDGKVTDGTELFGTKTGDAYAELAQYDDDHNGWIDENDAIFQRLKLWQNQSDASATITLAEAGVGAIYLGNGDFSQELRGEQGALLGKTKQAGIVLMEDGQVKTSQAIDLAEIPQGQAASMIENSLAFKKLKKIADAFNQTQRAVQGLQSKQSFQKQETAFQQFRFGWSLSQQNESEPAPKSLFEQLQEYIEKELAARKRLLAWLEKRYGNEGKQ